jgi:hypothetical protein
MAGADWTYTIKTSQIPNMDLRRLDVTVSFLDTPEDILADLAGFVRPPQIGGNSNLQGGQDGSDSDPEAGSTDVSSAGTGFGAGFTPLDPNAIYTAGEDR